MQFLAQGVVAFLVMIVVSSCVADLPVTEDSIFPPGVGGNNLGLNNAGHLWSAEPDLMPASHETTPPNGDILDVCLLPWFLADAPWNAAPNEDLIVRSA